MLDPTALQLCHRLAADSYDSDGTLDGFSSRVRLDPRFADLNGRIQGELLARAVQLRDLWLAKGVSEPIKQNFLDDLSEPVVLISEVNVMASYDFEARIPLDHVVALVKNFRAGDFSFVKNGREAASALGEASALIESGFMVTLQSDELPSTMDGCLLALDVLTVEDSQAVALSPSIWIPIVMKLLALWLARQGN
jgi:hypothetical protein